MSRENVEVIRGMWDAFLAGDIPTALTFCDPDVVWDGTNLPDGSVGRGHEAILEHIGRWAEQWEDWTIELEQIVDSGDEHVVLVMRETGRSNSGLEMDERHAELYVVREGKVVRREGFSDPRVALEAVGLRD
jgi:ketosteroid isomerase-like protein